VQEDEFLDEGVQVVMANQLSSTSVLHNVVDCSGGLIKFAGINQV